MGEMVQFPFDGGNTGGYLATPKQGSGPGVVVIQEWWGLVDHIKDVCDRFADEGFVALAPDLYHGKTTKSPDEAGKLMMALRIDEAERDLGAAVQYLLTSDSTTSKKIGVVGFCMGGRSGFVHCDEESEHRRLRRLLWWTSEGQARSAEPECAGAGSLWRKRSLCHACCWFTNWNDR